MTDRTRKTTARTCPGCRSDTLVLGRAGHGKKRFFPDDRRFLGYATRAFLCVDCGYLGHYLPEKRLREIQERYAV